jgi:acetolactate synthase-1/2/3 large subunit
MTDGATMPAFSDARLIDAAGAVVADRPEQRPLLVVAVASGLEVVVDAPPTPPAEPSAGVERWIGSIKLYRLRLIIVCFSAPTRRLTARLHAKETTSMTIDVATGISRILKEEGVGWVSTFPVCRVNNALGREGVPMLMMRDDRYAVAVADAFSRITGGSRIGVCTFQGGVNAAGMQYAYAGMAQAYEDGSPVLCITDGVPAGSSGNSQYDVASAMKTVSKWFGYLDKPERTPEIMRRAFTMLRSGRPGPVILAIPNATATYDETADPYRPVKGWKSAPDPADVRAAVDQLLGARNPLIYAGEGVIYAGAAEDLKALAEFVNAPVITTLKAKGAFPENHPLFVGVRGDQVAHYLNKSDLILAIGSSLSPGRFSHGIPDPARKTIIHCNIDELHINKMYPTAHAVIGDARLTLQALRQEVSDRTSGAGRTAGDVAAEVKAARDQGLARYRQVMNSDEKPINPYRVYGDLMEVLDLKNSFVTHESGNTRDQLSTVFDTLIPRGFLGWGNVSTLGFSLAAAIAAKKAFPERASVAVTGEAGLGYMLGNLEVLLREKLGVTVVHISNGGFAGYGPGFWGPGHDPFTHRVLGPDDVDMSKVIGALGFHTERVSEPAEVIPALRRALDVNTSGRPAYIEFVCCQYPVYGQWVGRGEG